MAPGPSFACNIIRKAFGALIMVFRISAKNLYLTYPKCPITPLYCLEQLQIHFSNHTFKHSICQENHQDGTLHLHVLLCFVQKVSEVL